MRKYIILLVFIIIGCGKEVSPARDDIYSMSCASNLGDTIPQPGYNRMTRHGIDLGRKLFYDPILSGKNQFSCATCHKISFAMSDTMSFSPGIDGSVLHRNTQPLFNLAWAQGYFWDGGAKNLESQVFGPLKSIHEMDQNLTELSKELTQKNYQPLFMAAFGSDTITSAAIARAIAQFERSLVSSNSIYDHYIRKEKSGSLTVMQQNGMAIFINNCSGCHKPDLFSDYEYHNNGLDSTFDEDILEGLYTGRYRITQNRNDLGKYKTPSVRNLKWTSPYMHDGRFSTLDEVINHYSTGIKYSITLDKNLPVGGFGFTTDEKNALRSFLDCLADEAFINNPAHASPTAQ